MIASNSNFKSVMPAKQMICTLIKIQQCNQAHFSMASNNSKFYEHLNWLFYSFFLCTFCFVVGLHRMLRNQSHYWSGSASCFSTKSKILQVRFSEWTICLFLCFFRYQSEWKCRSNPFGWCDLQPLTKPESREVQRPSWWSNNTEIIRWP